MRVPVPARTRSAGIGTKYGSAAMGRDKDVLVSGMRSGSRRSLWRRRANSGPAVEGGGKGAATVKSGYSITAGFPKNKFLIGNLMGLVCDKTSRMLFQMHTVWLAYVLRHRQACGFVNQNQGRPEAYYLPWRKRGRQLASSPRCHIDMPKP